MYDTSGPSRGLSGAKSIRPFSKAGEPVAGSEGVAVEVVAYVGVRDPSVSLEMPN
jgi:hypothetical protein